jgi:DNA-binding MarR family transcriptional regulator
MSNRADTSFAFTHHVRDHCLCLHVQRAARALARRFDAALRPAGLTQGQFSLLTSLNRAEPPTIGSVANLLALDRTTLTANLKPLERRGLVKVVVDPHDKRSRRLILTAAGRASLAAAAPIWKREHARVERLLQTASSDVLRAGLREVS